MSIEKLLERLADALEANTAAQEKVAAVLTKGATPAKTTKKAAEVEEEEEETAPKSTKKAAAEKKPAAKKGKAPTEEALREAFGEFLAVDDADEKAERKKHVAAILKKYKVAKATELAEEDRAAAIAALADYAPEEEEEEEDMI